MPPEMNDDLQNQVTETQSEGTPSNEGNPSSEANADPSLGDPAAPAYTPSYRYSVLGKVGEIPENFRPYIKDAETERTFRDLFEKSGAMDHFKNEYSSTKQRLDKIRGEYEPIMADLNDLKELRASGDLGAFFEKLGFNEEEILQYAVEKVKQMQLPEDQRRLRDDMGAKERELRELRKASESSQKQMQDFLVSQKQRELSSEISRPEVKTFMEDFDKRAGRQGAFVEEILYRGDRAWQQGKDLTAGEVISQIMGLFNFGNSAQPADAPVKPKVIPNVAGRTGSPAPGVARSIDDLRKLADSM